MTDALRYPIGTFTQADRFDSQAFDDAVAAIANLPRHLRAAVNGLTDEQLDTPYRDGGWTVRQVVHHLVDSHVNGYVRTKLAATEDAPALRTYEEQAWAELADGRTAPVDLSLPILDALHARWSGWLRTLDAATRARRAAHPEWGQIDIDYLVQVYAWHSRHHVAHITSLSARRGWTRA